jgi:hypothetical protein
MDMAIEKLLTPAEAARELGVTEIRVRQFCQEERIGFKFNGRWVIPFSDLNQFKRIERKSGRPKNFAN